MNLEIAGRPSKQYHFLESLVSTRNFFQSNFIFHINSTLSIFLSESF
uniref:Uncharacterized protein n=1 Tax=Daphnia magna TaxID=35525 RepID=A0A0P5TQ89_9CRUS